MAKLFHQWKEGERVADSERVCIKRTVTRMEYVYFVIISENYLHMVGEDKLGFEFSQVLSRHR